MSSNLKMVVTGGGTGGHFFPAQTIKNALEAKGVEVKYIGSKFGLEASFYNNCHDKALLLSIRGIQRQINISSIIKNISFPFNFLISYYQSRIFLKRFKPNIVIGTGGYSSGLPLLAAIHMGIKTVIQEQNSYPGITTHYLSNKVNKICIAYKDIAFYLKKKNYILTGNPIRDCIIKINKKDAKHKLNFNIDKPVLTILGGSQGSYPLNKYFIKNYMLFINSGIQILWQCGKKQFHDINNIISNENIKLIPFTNEMNLLYSASDLIVSRSGALALSEMSLIGKAMILIPFPNSAANHQVKNAELFANHGAAILFKQSNLYSGKLENKIINLIANKMKLNRMEHESMKLSIKNSTDKIINIIMELINN